MKRAQAADDASIPKNLIGAKASSLITAAPAAGKKKISRVSCAEIFHYRCEVCAAGTCPSDGKGVVTTFFLIRYQRVVASRREINFACQLFRIRVFIVSM